MNETKPTIGRQSPSLFVARDLLYAQSHRHGWNIPRSLITQSWGTVVGVAKCLVASVHSGTRYPLSQPGSSGVVKHDSILSLLGRGGGVLYLYLVMVLFIGGGACPNKIIGKAVPPPLPSPMIYTHLSTPPPPPPPPSSTSGYTPGMSDICISAVRHILTFHYNSSIFIIRMRSTSPVDWRYMIVTLSRNLKLRVVF